MPQLMGPEAIGGDASKHPLVKRLQAVEPVLEFLHVSGRCSRQG
jgi:hypothetical protein